MMRDIRAVAALGFAALAAFAHADGQAVLGKYGQAISRTTVYSSPSSHARVFGHVPAYQYMIIRHTDNSGWYAVYLNSGNYGYTPAAHVALLPYTVYAKKKSRSSYVASRSGNAMVDYAVQFTGTPYEWGGNDLSSGIDCSGFVKQVAGKIGLDLPRTAAEQVYVGTPIYRLEDLRAGDRLYFYDKGRGKIGHTGIYMGNGNFIHSSHGKGGVHTDSLTAGWRKTLVAARR